MGHHISAIIAKLPCDEDRAKDFDLPVFNERGFAIVGLDAPHSDHWSEKLGIPYTSPEFPGSNVILDSPITHHFAKELFGGRRYALIETDYFGGQGDQVAAVYENGEQLLATERARSGPINEALNLIGVRNQSSDVDHFASINLDKYRDFDDEFDDYPWPDID